MQHSQPDVKEDLNKLSDITNIIRQLKTLPREQKEYLYGVIDNIYLAIKDEYVKTYYPNEVKEIIADKTL